MKKILIVNNDPDTMELLQELLQLKGFEIRLNDVREEFLLLLNSFKPHLILLDISRQEISDEVKDLAVRHSTPVLLMTGHNSYPYARENGFKNFIKKPFLMADLLKKIDLTLNDVVTGERFSG